MIIGPKYFKSNQFKPTVGIFTYQSEVNKANIASSMVTRAIQTQVTIGVMGNRIAYYEHTYQCRFGIIFLFYPISWDRGIAETTFE